MLNSRRLLFEIKLKRLNCWLKELRMIIQISVTSMTFSNTSSLEQSGWYIARINFRCKSINTLRPRQDGRHFPDDIFNWIFLNENVWISMKKNLLKFVPKGPIDKIPAWFQIMAWRRPGDKPLSEAMLVSLLTHKCVIRPQWVKINYDKMVLNFHRAASIRASVFLARGFSLFSRFLRIT